MEILVRFLNKALSFVAFVTAATLVLYMLVVIITGTFDVALLMQETFLLDPQDRQAVFNSLNGEFLHNVAVLLILMKAYRILIEYMRHHHIDLKYMVEIAVIACVLELLFNYAEYSQDMRLILLGLSVGFLGLYVWRYDVLLRAIKDTQAAQTLPPTEPVVTPKKPKSAPKKRTRKIASK